MSLNFYYRASAASEVDEKDHIGLSTRNTFQFRVYPRQGLTTSAAWKEFLAQEGRVIVDECNDVWQPAEFFKFLDIRRFPDSAEFRNSPELAADAKVTKQIHRYRDSGGHLFCNYEFS